MTLAMLQDPEQYYDPPGGLLSFDIKVGQRQSRVVDSSGNHLLLMDLAKPLSLEGHLHDFDFDALEARMAQVRGKACNQEQG